MRYNRDFTDVDMARLVNNASLANQAQHRFHTCGWVTGQRICSELIQGHDFTEHLRTHHGVTGSDRTPTMCCWVDCYAEMKRDSLARHVQEKHLEWKYACPSCSEQFTRNHTMNNHVRRVHPSS